MPEIERFINADVLRGDGYDPLTLNGYAFANGNPVFHIDPFGRSATLIGFGHTVLGLAGLIPGVGEVFDIVNGTWYAAEGDLLNAGLSFGSAIPFAGYAATGAKIGIKIGKEVGGEALEAGTKQLGKGRVVNPSKGESEILRGFDNVKGSNIKTGGIGKEKKYYRWDYTHNDIEVFGANKKHLGSMDPVTGEMYKPPVVGRKL